MKRTAPLLVIGFDAGDPALLETFLREGAMPCTREIVRSGCVARTGGPSLVSEHGSWLSLFSGMHARQTGYFDYRQLRAGTYRLETVDGRDVEAPPFWADLGEYGLRALVVDAPDQRPVRGLPGLQLADWDTHAAWDPSRFQPEAEPPELLDEVLRHHGGKRPVIEKLDSTPDEDRELLGRALEDVAAKGELVRDLAGRANHDLVVTVFSEPHAAGHQFWRYGSQVSDRVDAPGLEHAIREVYGAVDREIGRLRALLPDGHDVVIVSSVGLSDHFPARGLADGLLLGLGYRSPAGGTSLRPLDLARKLLPRGLRVAISRHLPREQREDLLADRFRSGTDWGRTQAFVLHSPYVSQVRVNLEGREPQGTVSPGAAYDALLDRLEADFRALRDPVRDVDAVQNVLRTVHLFPGPPPRVLPDLWIEWREGRFMERVVHPKTAITQTRPEWFRRSAHSREGFLAASGPSVSKGGDLGTIDALDVAPTLRYLLGLAVPERMTGSPASDLLARSGPAG